MKNYYFIIFSIVVSACQPQSQLTTSDGTGVYKGLIEHGNFSEEIYFEVELDSTAVLVFVSSLGLNMSRIPLKDVEVKDDSINFKLQSDFYTFTFRNKWVNEHNKLQGSLMVDTVVLPYALEKELSDNSNVSKIEELSFESNGLRINATIRYPEIKSIKGLVLVTSSQNWDRSSSRAEAILYAQKGYTTFHYDKRGTGKSEGDWRIATMEELLSDDMNAIRYFSSKTGIPLSDIGIKGSSQGGTKIPYILNELQDLKYGVVVSCPGTSLLESDLNYWRNRNIDAIGKDIDEAMALVRKYYEYAAGVRTKVELEEAMEAEKSKSWYPIVGITDLDEQKIDKKLLFSPVPYFEKTKQPILVIQGTMDEIIPLNSIDIIEGVLIKAGNNNYKTVLLENASHSMNYIGKSDFPYMRKLHREYLKTVEDWMETVSNKK